MHYYNKAKGKLVNKFNCPYPGGVLKCFKEYTCKKKKEEEDGKEEKTYRKQYIPEFYFKKVDTKECLPVNLAPSF